MIKVEIDYFSSRDIINNNIELCDKLMALPDNYFITKPRERFIKDDKGNITNIWDQDFHFYLNDLSDMDSQLLSYCKFKPVESLTMMNESRINTLNVLEAVKQNQNMLPNNLLLEMKELMVLENACTDEVNKLLNNDEGWRIIAVLPQYNQRRPDYIFGRVDK